MTSTLDFYKLPINLYSKNFIMESLETYLGTLTPKTITSFQYQRFEMEKRIKVNLSQDYQTYNGLTKYNYLRISQYNDNNALSVYYYFIKSAKQISESTIEFVIVMDVLNTFKYSTSIGQNNYNISEKSLITREHKNRFDPYFGLGLVRMSESEQFTASECLIDASGTNLTEDTPVYYLDLQSLQEYVNDGWISILFYYYEGDLLNPDEYFDGVEIYIDGVLFDTGEGVHIDIGGISTQDHAGGVGVVKYWNDLNSDSLVGLKFLYKEHEFYGETDGLYPKDWYDYFNNNKPIFKISSTATELYRVIDRYQEGIDSIFFKVSESTLYDGDGDNQWYVVYSTANAVVDQPTDTEAKYVNPINIGFYSDYGYTKVTSTAVVVYYTASQVPKVDKTREFLFITKDMLGATGYIEVNGTKYYASDLGNQWQECFCFEKTNNNDLTFSKFGIICRTEGQFFTRQWLSTIANNISGFYLYDIEYIDMYCGWTLETSEPFVYQSISINSGTSVTTFTSPSFRDIDLTNPQLVKIINFPYAPFNALVGLKEISYIPENMVQASDCLMLYRSQQTQFNRNINFPNENPLFELKVQKESFIISKRESRDIVFESKLYHSDFYQPKFVYDSFTFSFRLEDCNLQYFKENFTPNFIVQYVCSNNVQSKFMFKFNQYICDREYQDYNNVLIVERNNEKALYTNDFIKYIKSGGYRYDSKKADTQKLVNGLTIPLATIGSGAGIGAMLGATAMPSVLKIGGAVVGAVVGTAVSTINAIHQAQQNDRQIAQKLLVNAQQSTSVSASEDIDILKAYSENKAKLCYYRCSDELRNALWDLFHYFGYKCYEYKKPVINTRCNFNFVQGEIVLQDYTFNEDIANAIIEKYKEGVTFMHYDNSLGYDFTQQYENFETSLF